MFYHEWQNDELAMNVPPNSPARNAAAVLAAEVGPRFNPWTFIPVLYFMQAIPVTLVQEVATIVYKDLGIANEPITRWTSLISLPWALQMLLGPLVDLNSTKRKWTLTGQAMIALGLILAAFANELPGAFAISLVILGATAVTSALCNIATDGFYMLALNKDLQAVFAGVQSTSYRFGRLFCVGVLVGVAGILTDRFHLSKEAAWTVVMGAAAVVYGLGYVACRATLPYPEADVKTTEADSKETSRNVARTFAILTLGVGGYFMLNALTRLSAQGLWQVLDGQPNGALHGWILPAQSDLFGFLLPGIQAEQIQLGICASVVVIAFFASRALLRGSVMEGAFTSFLRLPKIGWIFGFILFYRFGEAMVSKMSPLFLKDSVAAGGLAINNEQLGAIKGIAGVSGIILGGLAGGLIISRLGIKKAFLPMAILMHVPNLLYLWASLAHPVVGAMYFVDFMDQFGYGFGFAGYMIYLMRVAQRGNYRTAHYAIGTGLGALCIVMAGILSGILQHNFGYPGFFTAVMICTIPGTITLFFIPLDDPIPPAEPIQIPKGVPV